MTAKLHNKIAQRINLTLVRLSYFSELGDWAKLQRCIFNKIRLTHVFLCRFIERGLNKQTNKSTNNAVLCNIHSAFSTLSNDNNANHYSLLFILFQFYWWQSVWLFLSFIVHTHTHTKFMQNEKQELNLVYSQWRTKMLHTSNYRHDNFLFYMLLYFICIFRILRCVFFQW